MKMRNHRAIRYELRVEGNVIAAHGQWKEALKRAKIIVKTWGKDVELIDTWAYRHNVEINQKP